MENLSDVEKRTLQRLQDAYCKENKALSFPLLPQHCTSAASVIITPQSAQSAGDRTHFSGDSTSGSEGQNSLKRQNSLLARGRLMVSKAKQKLDEVDGCTPGFMSASQRQDVGDFDNIGTLFGLLFYFFINKIIVNWLGGHTSKKHRHFAELLLRIIYFPNDSHHYFYKHLTTVATVYIKKKSKLTFSFVHKLAAYTAAYKVKERPPLVSCASCHRRGQRATALA